jgi:hypothetical protein
MIPLPFKFNTLTTLTQMRKILVAGLLMVGIPEATLQAPLTLMATAYPTAKTNFQMTQLTPLLLVAMGNMR